MLKLAKNIIILILCAFQFLNEVYAINLRDYRTFYYEKNDEDS